MEWVSMVVVMNGMGMRFGVVVMNGMGMGI
jgi:hypothetical protein